MIHKQQICNVISAVLVFIAIITVLSTVFSISHYSGNGIVSGKYFRFYGSVALLSVTAIPVAIIKRGERLHFNISDLLILLFCLAAMLITLYHTGRLTNRCMLLIFLLIFYFYLRELYEKEKKHYYCNGFDSGYC
jgi:hypothetical protein